jgi:hypothetical protein|tara:strand:+ start:499 stop:1272 length:774 start_codon:yes stop_codon:yes gene_type:complete
MSINMELMKQKLASLRGEGTGDRGPSIWFKPDEGDQDIRIVPTADGDPLKEMYFHYNVGEHKGGILCPKRNFGERCPVCDFASALWREGTEKNDDESKKLAKSLFVRQRYFSPVVVRGREEEGIKVYGYGKTAYELLLGYILDPEYGDITDTVEGTDITLTYTKPTRPGAYPQTNLKMRRGTSPLLSDEDALPGLLQNMPDFDSLFERLTPEQVDAILDEQLSSDSSAEGRSRQTESYGKKNEASDVDKAFDELMAG